MNSNGSSSVDPPQELSRMDIPPEDLQKMMALYQKCPQLWEAFRDIAHVVVLMTTKLQADQQLFRGLLSVTGYVEKARTQDKDDVIHFISFSGFVEGCVCFSRQILREMGKTYITEFPQLRDCIVDEKMICLRLIRGLLLNCTADSSEFSLRLTKTGFLQDLLEDVAHIQHLSVEALERGDVFLTSLGTIHNCCLYPDSAATVKQLDIVPHVTTFLTKRGSSLFVPSVAVAVLANVVKEEQLDLLALDADVLQYFLTSTRSAVSTNKASSSHWRINEILFNLCLMSRQDFNRRLMVAQGILSILCSVLEPSKKRSEDEQKNALALVSRLIEDEINLQVGQNYPQLLEILMSLKTCGTSETKEKVQEVLDKFGQVCAEDLDDRIPAFPHVSHLLADQANVLGILNMGLVEFVLDELKVFTDERGHRSDATAAAHGPAASCQQVLMALSELADDDVYRREIMSRGGLTMVRSVLQRGSHEDKMEAARTILTLSMVPENRAVMQIDADLTTLLADLEQRADNKELAQLAENIRLALRQ